MKREATVVDLRREGFRLGAEPTDDQVIDMYRRRRPDADPAALRAELAAADRADAAAYDRLEALADEIDAEFGLTEADEG